MRNLNRGILTAKNVEITESDWKYLARQNGKIEIYHEEVMSVQLWKVIMIVIAFSSMSASLAYSVRTEPEVITIEKPVPTCATPLSMSRMPHYRGMVQQLAAAIPETALRNHR